MSVMRTYGSIFIIASVIIFSGCGKEESRPLKIAVEFVDHAASAHIARAKKWFEKEGLEVESFDNYITGMALSAALIKGDIDAAYLCMIPAICAYANGGVKLKVVCGTHKYGYGMLVNPEKIKSVSDLMKPGIRIACPREGSPPDALMNKMIEKYKLNGEKLKKKVLRMPPPKILLALQTGQIDAGFCCEQFPAMGERMGFNELLSARDLWPDMQGSVLVVKDELLKNHPQAVKKLVKITKRGIDFINQRPDEASVIAADALTVAGKKVLPLKIGKIASKLEIRPEDIKKSLMEKMINTPEINAVAVQEEIDYLYKLGYIKKNFKAEEILDLKFL
ncbi:MAG: ABC transporter substrate-binding protein [Elusimicrobiota bacterium]|nr:ABC transporter substrate-binding protein [Elusimicrobiota bacterium]